VSYGVAAVRDAFRLYLARPSSFVAGGLVLAALLAWSAVLGADSGVLAPLILATSLATGIFDATVAALAAARLAGKEPRLASALAVVLGRLDAVVGAVIVVILIPTSTTILASIVGFAFLTAPGVTPALAVPLPLAVAGGLVALVWTVVVWLRLLYVIPAIVLDGLGLAAALGASWRASGRRLRAGIYIAVLGIGITAPATAIQRYLVVPASGGAAAGGSDGGAAVGDALVLLLSVAVGLAVLVITLPVEPIARTIAYRRLSAGQPSAVPVTPAPPSRLRAAYAVGAALVIVWVAGFGVYWARVRTGAVAGTGEAGVVAFGLADPADGLHCRPLSPVSALRVDETLHWAALLSAPLPDGAKVELAVSRDGRQPGRASLGSFEAGVRCITGSSEPGSLAEGAYRFEVFVNGASQASGSFTMVALPSSPGPASPPSSPTHAPNPSGGSNQG
jgi:hypothetical protein